MTKREALNGKPYAGNPHVRFDEGENASATTSRCGSLLYSAFGRLAASAFAALSIGFVAVAEDAASAPEVVWVKADKAAFESQGVVGDGTEANPFNTIQKGIDTVAVGGTVKIMAGTYDYDEQFDGTHTNRVIINTLFQH